MVTTPYGFPIAAPLAQLSLLLNTGGAVLASQRTSRDREEPRVAYEYEQTQVIAPYPRELAASTSEGITSAQHTHR